MTRESHLNLTREALLQFLNFFEQFLKVFNSNSASAYTGLQFSE